MKIISAFPACGKTYAFENYQHVFKMLDSDSSEFSWVKDVEGNNTKERNLNFPQNYIDHIIENKDKYDIIFVSSHEVVRRALTKSGIRFVSVIPDKSLLNEWVGRMYMRGDNEKFIKFISDNWDNFLDDIWIDSSKVSKLKSNKFLDVDILRFLVNWD